MFRNYKSRIFSVICLLLTVCMVFCGCTKEENGTMKIYSSTGDYTLIEKFSPNTATSYDSGQVIVVTVKAKTKDLTVTAEFNGETVTLTKEMVSGDDEELSENAFFMYSSSFSLPFTTKDTVLGQVKFTCTDSKTTEIYYSGLITVLKAEEGLTADSTHSAVGERYIAEVQYVPAETFNGDTVDDTSLPTNSYLPVGTVDYCSSTAIINEGIEKSYRLLRCGKRVYDNENLKVYEGKLPSSNMLSLEKCETQGKYTVISLYSDWKAPFTVQLKEQEFIDAASGNFRIKEATYSYVEIRFMYCEELLGAFEFSKENPLFEKGEVSYEEDCAVLKLRLKKDGGFYGWRAEYDQYGSLLLRFLEPTRLYSKQNEYGCALYDKVIVVDAGHGGNDPGAVAEGFTEAQANLSLANILKRELEAIGATVVMTRTDNSPLNSAQRTAKVLEAEPDFLISIHRNGGPSNGFGAYYYNPFSAKASQYIYEETWKTGMYRKSSGSTWHYFFLNRVGICPSVLTENGYLTDKTDRADMKNPDHQTACARALVKGIVEYFKSQQL